MRGHIRKKLYRNREIVVEWTVGLWEQTVDSGLKWAQSWDQYKRSKNTFDVTSIALILVPLGTKLLEVPAQFLTGSPGTCWLHQRPVAKRPQSRTPNIPACACITRSPSQRSYPGHFCFWRSLRAPVRVCSCWFMFTGLSTWVSTSMNDNNKHWLWKRLTHSHCLVGTTMGLSLNWQRKPYARISSRIWMVRNELCVCVIEMNLSISMASPPPGVARQGFVTSTIWQKICSRKDQPIFLLLAGLIWIRFAAEDLDWICCRSVAI